GCGLGKTFELARLRYDRLIILADADADGNHIATLLLTFLYRYLPKLITNGKVFLAQPPLYRVDAGKQTHWALDDQHLNTVLEEVKRRNSQTRPEVTRFKGLGEMMPKVLWDTTLNPKTRRLLRVSIADQIGTDRIIADLMGRDASARFRFIMDRAESADALDV
ncbi:MAG: toprim domain-containing protein, partial [Acidobacteriota bacterium]|nr:toprim domain-containing protein [Acidobacteriota bacterium]